MSESISQTGTEQVKQWIEGARAGEADCLGWIAATYRNYLLLVANQELDEQLQAKLGASDLVQETLLLVQDRFHQFRGQSEEELLSWLRQILHNQLADAARRFKQADKRKVSREQPLEGGARAAVPARRLASSERTPRAELIYREESAALAAALEQLPADYRQVIVLRSLERLSFAEVGRQMGRSAGAAGKLWARAIERLQEELESSHEQ